MSLVSDIGLIRPDTTLNFSQKAEKRMSLPSSPSPCRIHLLMTNMSIPSVWGNLHASPPLRAGNETATDCHT